MTFMACRNRATHLSSNGSSD